MKLGVNMTGSENELDVGHWWARTPEFVIESLSKQLQAAQAIWPELKGYEVAKKRSKRTAGEAGGHARADALSVERRSEIASNAAKARWRKPETAA